MVTLITATGETFNDGYRVTTTDAKQLQHVYCELDTVNFPNFEFKQTVSCTSDDRLGIVRELFADRLCDNVADCGDGEDESGDLANCIPKTAETSNGCCGSFNFPGRGECISSGELYNGKDVWQCDNNGVVAWFNGKGSEII